MSTVKVTNLQNASSSSTNITLDTAGNATVAGTMAMGSSFLRNRIINGDMRIDQRNAGASVTPAASAYTVDRWQFQCTQASKVSLQQGQGISGQGFSNSLTAAVAVAVGSPAATDFFAIRQAIEGFNIADLDWGSASAKSITLSFWARSSLTGTFGGAVNNSALNRSYPFTYSISSANTWEKKTIVIPGDTSGTWLTNNGVGINLWFSLCTGSTYSGTANTWAGTLYINATGSTNVLATLSASIAITGVQLESGTVATPFERRQYGQELALCQRYYQRVSTDNAFATFASGYNTGTTGAAYHIAFPVSMRTRPTALETSGTAAHYDIAHAATSTTCSAVPTFQNSTVSTMRVDASVASGLTTGQGSLLRGASTSAYLGWSAEL